MRVHCAVCPPAEDRSMLMEDRKRGGLLLMRVHCAVCPPAEDRPMSMEDRKREGYF